MKNKYFKLSLSFLLLFFIQYSIAQIPIPYATDFEPADQSDWTQYRTGLEHSFDWGFTSNSPYFLGHDYPVGNMSADTVRDWMVSPEINFHSTSKLDIRAEVFTFVEVGSTDYFGIWFSDGSPNPADGDYVEIVDLTNFTPNDVFKDTMGIEIPYTADNGYLAIRYETTNNWFVISVDSLRITPDNVVSSQELNDFSKQVSLFPNPVVDAFSIKANIPKQGTLQINLLDTSGRIVQQIQKAQVNSGIYQESFSLSNVKPGFYLLDIVINDLHTTKKLVFTP